MVPALEKMAPNLPELPQLNGPALTGHSIMDWIAAVAARFPVIRCKPAVKGAP